METKLCKACMNEKAYKDFSKCSKCKDKLQYRCKKCDAIKRKERWRLNKKEESLKNKKYYQENKDRAQEYAAEYFQKNKEKLIKQRKNRRHTCIKTKLIHNYRGLISSSFKRALEGGIVKKSKSLKILGCSMDYFMEYIESMFVGDMSWDNYGACLEADCRVWNLDHCYPISLAKSEEEIIKLNHYTNLQPMWAIENIKKSNNT